MPRTMNSEVSVFDFAGTVKDVKDAFTRDMVSENTETTTVASKSYSAGETFIWTDRKVYKAKSAIASGDTLNAAANGNIEAVGDLADAVVENKEGLESVSDLVDYVVNHQGLKNLLPNDAVSTTNKGITCVVNPDGSITTSGVADSQGGLLDISSFKVNKTGQYILSGTPAELTTRNKSGEWYLLLLLTDLTTSTNLGVDYGDGKTFTLDATHEYHLAIWTHNAADANGYTFYPMIRPAEIEDDTYVPYSKSTVELTGAVTPMLNELGAKNLLPNTATSQVVNGVTFTVNSDGSVKANGTATSNLSFTLANFHIKAGKYIISDAAIVTSGQIIQLIVDPSNAIGASATRIAKCSGTDRKTMFTVLADVDATCYIWINSGTTLNNLMFYPMIRPASIEDDTYAPYAMTNRELTEKKIGQYFLNGNPSYPFISLEQFNMNSYTYNSIDMATAVVNSLGDRKQIGFTYVMIGASNGWAGLIYVANGKNYGSGLFFASSDTYHFDKNQATVRFYKLSKEV